MKSLPFSPNPPANGRRCIRRSGFARFTSARYSSKKEDISNTYIHLTNVAIQKHAPGFDRAKGMKWPIRSLRLYLITRHGGRARAGGGRGRPEGPVGGAPGGAGRRRGTGVCTTSY